MKCDNENLKEKAEIFLQLYKKYLFLKYENMKNILQSLPTNVINFCFDGVRFFDESFDVSRIEEVSFGVNGLCGYDVIKRLSNELEFLKKCDDNGELEKLFEMKGIKINRKKIGINI